MIQFGLRFHDSVEIPFEERLHVIKEQGFRCIHIALSKTPDLPAAYESLTPGYAAYLKKACDREDMQIAVLGCYLNLAHPDPCALSVIQKKYRAHLRFASQLGCGMVGTETGAPNAEYKYDKEACHSEEALRIFIENLKPVIADAEAMGVILAIEPVYKHIVWNPVRARQVLDEIHSPNLQIIFDPVNLLHPDNLDHRDEVIKEAIELLGEDIAMIHLKDYKVENGELTCMAPGLGDMRYDEVLKFAKERKPFIQATLENTKPDNAEASLHFLKELEGKL